MDLGAVRRRVLEAEPLRALTDLPSFDSSAMDGWAVAGEPPWLVGVVAQADIAREASDKKAERTIEKISEAGGKHSS